MPGGLLTVVVQDAAAFEAMIDRLRDLFARALHLAGRHEESNEQFARALEIPRLARLSLTASW